MFVTIIEMQNGKMIKEDKEYLSSVFKNLDGFYTLTIVKGKQGTKNNKRYAYYFECFLPSIIVAFPEAIIKQGINIDINETCLVIHEYLKSRFAVQNTFCPIRNEYFTKATTTLFDDSSFYNKYLDDCTNLVLSFCEKRNLEVPYIMDYEEYKLFKKSNKKSIK